MSHHRAQNWGQVPTIGDLKSVQGAFRKGLLMTDLATIWTTMLHSSDRSDSSKRPLLDPDALESGYEKLTALVLHSVKR